MDFNETAKCYKVVAVMVRNMMPNSHKPFDSVTLGFDDTARSQPVEGSSCCLATPSVSIDENGFRGILINLLDEIVKRYKVCYTVVHNVEGGGGKFLENGTYVGILSALNRDYDMAAFPVTRAGREAAQFSMSDFYILDTISVFYKYPKIEPDITGFTKPFSYLVWIMMACMFTICFLVDFFLLKTTSGSNIKKSTTDDKHSYETEPLYRSFITSWKVMFAQAFIPPASVIRRIFVGVWMIVGFLIISSYKCNLAATLIIPKVNIPFRTFHEMVNQDKIGWTILDGTLLQETAMVAPVESDFYKLHSKVTKYARGIGDIRYGIETGEYAIVINEGLGRGFVSYESRKAGHCVATQIEEKIWPNVMRIAFKKGSDLRDKFNYMMNRLMKAGILDWWKEEELKYALRCIGNLGKDERRKVRPLGMADIGLIFVILGTGLAVATLAFVLEFFLPKENTIIMIEGQNDCYEPEELVNTPNNTLM